MYLSGKQPVDYRGITYHIGYTEFLSLVSMYRLVFNIHRTLYCLYIIHRIAV